MTPLQAIKENCLNCTCGNKNEVKLCPITKCPLYQFRLGRKSDSKRTMSDEQKAAASERFKKMWEERRKNVSD